MTRVHVGVLRGGPSSEYDISLASGGAVLQNLDRSQYALKDIFIDRAGVWHVRGAPTDPARALADVDVAFNALHGTYGEDGGVQRVLETYRVPYTGSNVFGSAIAMDKARAREHLGVIPGIKMPGSVIIQGSADLDDITRTVFAQFGPPYVIKPLRGGSSIGLRVVDSIAVLRAALFEALHETDALIVEQFVRGREATVGIVEQLRGDALYQLPPVEIVMPEGCNVFDYNLKYSGNTEELCPAHFSFEEKTKLQDAARYIHQTLGLRHYSRADFIVAPSGIYFLEVNTLPGLTQNSLLPKALDAVGVPLPEFLDHLITIARTPHRTYA